MNSLKPTAVFPPLWQRRASAVTLFTAIFVVALGVYTIALRPAGNTGLMLIIPLILGLCGGLFALVNLLRIPEKIGVVFGFTGYVLVAAGLGTALVGSDTTAVHMLYVLLFCVIVFIGGIYGPLLLSLFVLYCAWYSGVYAMVGGGGVTQTASVILFYSIPVVASWLLWHGQAKRHNQAAAPAKGDDTTYNELAAQLSQVAGESDIVINTIADGVLALSGKGEITLINPAAVRMLGWAKNDALGLDYKSVMKIQDMAGNPIEQNLDPVMVALSQNAPAERSDVTLVTNSNKTFQTRIQITPVGQYGRGVIVVFRDITKEKAEEREQAEFVSTASHEMRTPVATMEGYLGLALNPATATIDTKARAYLTKAHESAQHLGRLFQDLLDITKADDGRLRNQPQVTDLVMLAGEITSGFNAKATEKGLTLIYEPEQSTQATEKRVAPVFYADIDVDHLREVLGNLIDNAIKYTKTGSVSVGVTGDNDSVEVTVRDSGIGIPREDISHLFQKFYRVDNSDTREIGGTGLGLYLSRRLVEIMGGKIRVDSEYGKGSTFTISFPRLEYEVAKSRLQALMEQRARQLEIEKSKQDVIQ